MFKIIKLTLLLFLAITVRTQAQHIEIIPQSNYTFGGKIHGRYGELKIQGSESYGISLDIVNKKTSFQIEYFYQPTTGNYRDYFNPDLNNQRSDLRISWYHVGVRQRFGTNEKVVPFAGASLGLTNFNLDSSPSRYNETALSFGLQTGTNIYLSDILGLRFHGRLNFPVQFNGFGFYAGTGGSGASASASAYFIQADLGAGLIFRLAN
ncbi:hypothetical protein [Cyclobacterium xiamenense]|uniref:hypothetical protein n=1 Tax=Cyclobacterium xiamenense TaxID=1297121 RepID=UPI0035D0DCF2